MAGVEASGAAIEQHPDTLFCATVIGNGVYKTEDGGATWVGMEIDSNLTRVQALALAPDDPNILYAGGLRGIDKTEDGGNSWSHLSLSRDVYALAVDPTNSDVVYAGTSYGGVFQSTDGGLSWNTQISGTGFMLSSSFFLDEDRGWVTGLNGQILRTTDGGNNWYSQNSGTDEDIFSISFIANSGI